jgi:hypothetical protein
MTDERSSGTGATEDENSATPRGRDGNVPFKPAVDWVHPGPPAGKYSAITVPKKDVSIALSIYLTPLNEGPTRKYVMEES